MSERKTINKYYPPNFDPSKLERRKRTPKGKDAVVKLQTVRLMTPYSMKCTSCGEYIYKGKKFNARKENTGEKYLGISILRFHIRCTRCSAEITFKTDPKNSDYVSERGAVRNFEPWRDPNNKDETEEERLDRLEREEEENAMQELDAKSVDAKREMEIADALDELRTRNALTEHVNPEKLLEVSKKEDDEVQKEARRQQDEEDAEAARQAFAEARKRAASAEQSDSTAKGPSSAVKKEPVFETLGRGSLIKQSSPLDLLKKRKGGLSASNLGITLKKPKVIQ
ncbi:CWC16 protein [Kockiozyma suomiensis]|uniref:CWC16 protein n=1 Tax=Kockiozyma suomiensis TaxID=1337062 RepID=UPI0033441D15